MLEIVKHTMQQYDMAKKGDTIVIGLSGGADSVALTHILWQLAKTSSFSLIAVHVHHGIRGTEAERDAAFSQRFAERLGIPFVRKQLDVPTEAKRRGMGEEETGRLLRYAILQEIAGVNGKIAVAHHMGDQAETLLMRLCRGTGLDGLTGIPPIRGNIIRPLLFCTRAQIEQYCEENALTFQQDSTNFDTTYTRNRLRHQVLPLLEQVHKGSTEHLAQTAKQLALENDFIQQQAKEAFLTACIASDDMTLSCQKLSALHPALCMRVLRLAITQANGLHDITQTHLTAVSALLEKQSGKTIHLPHGLLVTRSYDQLIFKKQQKTPADGFCYPLSIGTTTHIKEAGFAISLMIIEKKNAKITADCCTTVLDYDKITTELTCRTRKAGDRIVLSGGTKKLKKLWIDEKLPQESRNQLPLIACGNEIVWIYNRQLSLAFLPDAKTKRYLCIKITEE